MFEIFGFKVIVKVDLDGGEATASHPITLTDGRWRAVSLHLRERAEGLDVARLRHWLELIHSLNRAPLVVGAHALEPNVVDPRTVGAYEARGVCENHHQQRGQLVGHRLGQRLTMVIGNEER